MDVADGLGVFMFMHVILPQEWLQVLIDNFVDTINFLDGLNAKQVQKVLWVLRAVRELPQVPKQYFKKLDGTADLWEVRAEFGGAAFGVGDEVGHMGLLDASLVGFLSLLSVDGSSNARGTLGGDDLWELRFRLGCSFRCAFHSCRKI